MIEPTIDEMLNWLDSVNRHGFHDSYCNNAIRTILEQHREASGMIFASEDVRRIALEAIRAFVERAEKKAHATAKPYYWCEAFTKAVGEELVALESEVKE